MIKYLVFDRGDTIIEDLPESFGGMDKWPYYKAVDGVLETLPLLVKNYICIMASNTSISTTTTIRFALQEIGISNYFKDIYTQFELRCSKPEKEFYLTLLSLLNASPSEVCSIGNDLELDILPAKELGIHTILLDENKLYFTDDDYTINNFRDIPKILSKINH